MIIQLNENTNETTAEELAKKYEAFRIRQNGRLVLITPSSLKKTDTSDDKYIDRIFVFNNDMQLSSSEYFAEKREIKVGKLHIGGKSNHCVVIAGPCSIESEDQIHETAKMLVSQGITTLRAGCYKPRTSPYSFQGLGLEGLKLLSQIRKEYGLNIITEVRDATHIDEVIEYTDIIQVGAKAMYDQGILRRCAKTEKPVLIKRGFGATLQETVQAAEFVLSGGNSQVMLCERGIRTFENKTRFTLDLCGAAFLKHYTNLPLILDPSHAMGHAYGVPDLTRACVALGVEGLLLEAHPDPTKAKSDASQQLDHPSFIKLLNSLKPVAEAVGRKII